MSDIWLKVQLDKIETKIDKLDSRIDNVDITLAKQSVILEEHTRRSLANEEQLELFRKNVDIDLKPIKGYMNLMHAAFKLIGIISSIASFGYGVLKLFLFIKKI